MTILIGYSPCTLLVTHLTTCCSCHGTVKKTVISSLLSNCYRQQNTSSVGFLYCRVVAFNWSLHLHIVAMPNKLDWSNLFSRMEPIRFRTPVQWIEISGDALILKRKTFSEAQKKKNATKGVPRIICVTTPFLCNLRWERLFGFYFF